MAKKKEADRSNNTKHHTKKERRSRSEKKPTKQKDVLPPTPEKEVVSPNELNQTYETSTPDHEEEIVCAGEVEIQMSDDDVECVDIETSIEKSVIDAVARTPTPPSGSKKLEVDGDEKSMTSATSRLSTTPPASKASTQSVAVPPSAGSANTKKRNRRRDSGTSSDEERWLTAIESGKLEDVDDELKKIKNPKLMTARQRAMYERNMDKEPSPGGELLMSLPTGYREKEKPTTAEDIQKAALKSQKRKQLADEKREKDKKKTMERLLKKQETKQRSAVRNKNTKSIQPVISYRNTVHGATLSFPLEHEFPLKSQTACDPPKPQLCGISGCNNLKVYNCSKTKLPLCSFACYRKNVQAIRQIMF